MVEENWKKLFCRVLDKADRKKFDDMVDLLKIYIQPACISFSASDSCVNDFIYPMSLESNNQK